MFRLLLAAMVCFFITTPTHAQTAKKKAPTKEAPITAPSDGKININTATIAELNTLNGVGDVTAKRIIEYREANGPFKTIEELNKVSGIGDKTFAKFKDQITVGDGKAAPATGKEPPKTSVVPVTTTSASKININTATIAELNTLNGVGDVTAKRIIEYREANGPFKTIEELNNVSGIGDKTFAKFKDQITVGGDAGAPPAGVVPVEKGATSVVPVTKVPSTAIVNINTAGLKELGKLPGVGDTTAQRILEYREANGPFKACKDLGKVKGIGDKTLEKIEPSCTIK